MNKRISIRCACIFMHSWRIMASCSNRGAGRDPVGAVWKGQERKAGTTMNLRVGIVGGTGYAGGELLRILYQHDGVRVTYVASRSRAGERLDDVHPALAGCYDLTFGPIDADKLAEAADVVFLAVPHGASMELAPQLLDRGVKVVDLGADFHLTDAAVYEQWYGAPHTGPDAL